MLQAVKFLRAATPLFLGVALATYVRGAPHAEQAGAPWQRAFARTADGVAHALSGALGPSGAMLALLVLGLLGSVLLLLPMLRAGRGTRIAGPADAAPRQSQLRWGRKEPVAPLEVAELSAERLSALRHRGEGRVGPDPLSQVPPVCLVRRPRLRGEDWKGAPSWLGGLPRLGGAEWPRGADGHPLPFAAQVDLAQLAAACPQSPLPDTGSLAFFLGSGAVLHVPAPGDTETPPPSDLPAAMSEDGPAFPPRPTRLTRPLFPYWPIDPVAAPLPEDMRPTGAFGAAQVPGCERQLWWFAVRHLYDQLGDALDDAPREIAERTAAGDLPGAAELALEQAELLPLIEALEGFMADRKLWAPLTAEEVDIVEDLLRDARGRLPDLLRDRVPHGVEELATLCLRTMVTGSAAPLRAMPDAALDTINRACRVPTGTSHQLFGTGADNPAAFVDDVLLLQLAPDEMVDWRFAGNGVFQFRINPVDLERGHWERTVLTFTGG